MVGITRSKVITMFLVPNSFQLVQAGFRNHPQYYESYIDTDIYIRICSCFFINIYIYILWIINNCCHITRIIVTFWISCLDPRVCLNLPEPVRSSISAPASRGSGLSWWLGSCPRRSCQCLGFQEDGYVNPCQSQKNVNRHCIYSIQKSENTSMKQHRA